MPRLPFLVRLCVLGAMALPERLLAQCPDGTPPPCRAVTTPRRDPVVDDRTWLVVPFSNTTRAPDVAWIADASVSMLSIDMSRWTDYRVIDAERVTDLLQRIPEASRTPLGLSAALTMAKQAGAGRLVMGEYLREGSRTTVTARVFNVKTGQRLSTATESAAAPDSIAATYRRLAPRVLSVPLPLGTTISGIGTSSAEALRAYVLGLHATSRWRHDSARTYFARAVALDSTFALAQLRLAIELRLAASGSATPEWRRAYSAALRYSTDLPERERILVALGAAPLPQTVRCGSADRLLQLDSADAEGWLARGHCVLRDSLVIVDADGLARRASSLNAARLAFQRTLELLPKREALVGLLNLMSTEVVHTCAVAGPRCPPDAMYSAPVLLVADTVATPFAKSDQFRPHYLLRSYAASRRARLQWGGDFATRWAAQHPLDYGGRIYAGGYALWLGNLAVARTHFSSLADWAAVASTYNRNAFAGYLASLEWAAGRPDSAAALVATMTNVDHWQAAAIMGKLQQAASMRPAARRPAAIACDPLYIGVANDFSQQISACLVADSTTATRVRWYGPTLAFNTLRTRGAADTASAWELIRFQAYLSLGDTTKARAELARYDEWGAARAENSFDGYEMFAAESYAQLGDSVTAWRRIEPFASRSVRHDGAAGLTGLTGRTWLLYADLALATGHVAEAKRGYEVVVGMWSRGDPIVQPMVARAGEALQKLRAR